ncbi:MAG: HlyD family secretion protein, partial [Gammaproteobacteria bacterium]
MTAAFRDTAAQDRVLLHAPWWQRHRGRVAVAAGIVGALVLLVPPLLSSLSAARSVSRERLSIATVERGDFTRDIAAEGRVVAAVSPTLYAPAAGSVRFVVQAGHAVEKGQVLGHVDSPELTSELAQQRAQLQALDVDYGRAQLAARQQAIVAEQALEQARVDFEAATIEHERTSKGYALGVMPEIEVLRTQAALQRAEIAYKRARTDHGLQREGRHFDVEASRLARDRQQLLVDELQRRVDLLTLRSPVAGRVGQLIAAAGTTVARDAPLLTVVDLSALEVELRVPESFARDLAAGMPASIRGNGSAWRGEISAVAPEVVAGEVTRACASSAIPPKACASASGCRCASCSTSARTCCWSRADRFSKPAAVAMPTSSTAMSPSDVRSAPVPPRSTGSRSSKDS